MPAHNRADNLALTLSNIVPLLPSSAQILVIDDFSSVSAIASLCAQYPDVVTYVRTPRNMGVIGARNFGVARVDTEFLIHLDDDSYFLDVDFIPKTLALFRDNPDAAVIAYNISTPDRSHSVPPSTAPYLCRTYVGCGNAWRMSAITALGYYYEGFWRQGEEVEHALRVYDAGYTVLAAPQLVVRHEESPINRDATRHLSLEAANYLKRIALRVPARCLPQMLARWFGFVAMHHKRLSIRQIWRDLTSDNRSLARAMRDRAPVTAATFRKVEELKRAEAVLIRHAGMTRA